MPFSEKKTVRILCYLTLTWQAPIVVKKKKKYTHGIINILKLNGLRQKCHTNVFVVN